MSKLPTPGARESRPWESLTFSNQNFWDNASNLYYAYIVNRTLAGDFKHVFQPDEVIYVGKYPSAYLISVDQFREDELRRWQRFLWNQAVVPLLIVRSRDQIRVYSANESPLSDNSDQRITYILSCTADALELSQIYASLQTGSFYTEHRARIKRQNAVDQYLLRNLNAAAKKLAAAQDGGINSENLEFSQRFLIRILFICYLFERGMIKGEHFEDLTLRRLRVGSYNDSYLLRDLLNELKTSQERIDALLKIFRRVHDRFNGSLFIDSLNSEQQKIREPVINIVIEFLNGHDLESGQQSLGFWAYDFSVIPIEIISSVYEGFLKAQGDLEQSYGRSDIQRKVGAYYTPPHLAELAVDIALEGCEIPVHDIRVLDPACGSGVFLVSLFGRMANSLRRVHRYKGKRESISWGRKVLRLLNQLHGIDSSKVACHITCFSMYLAVLDQLTPMDVEYLYDEKERLPTLLDDKSGSIRTIHTGNVFDPELDIGAKEFDYVLGNPPWVSRTHQCDSMFLRWMDTHPEYPIPSKQIAHGFMWKAKEYLSSSGRACFLLPAAVLLNSTTNQFQLQWFRQVCVTRVVNFSDLSFVLFPGSQRACVAICFLAEQDSSRGQTICYESPKCDSRSLNGGPVSIREEDTTYLKLSVILNAAKEERVPEIWKISYWGSWRDKRLLARLGDMPRLQESTNSESESLRWIKGQGVIKNGQEQQKGWWKDETPCIKGSSIPELVVTEQDCQPFKNVHSTRTAHRPRRAELFEGPKVLVSQGSRNMKVAYCNFTVFFQHCLQTITGSARDADMLRFLSIVLKSDIAQYYLFHTSANWGIERDKVHFHELLSMPFPLPEHCSDVIRANEIVNEISARLKSYERTKKSSLLKMEHEIREFRLASEQLLLEYYDINEYEQFLIEDTVKIIIPSSTPSTKQNVIPTLKRVTKEDCIMYANTLCCMLTALSTKNGQHISARVLLHHPYSLICIRLTGHKIAVEALSSRDELNAALNRIANQLQVSRGGFVFDYNLKVFDADTLYILKPSEYRFWMKSTALNDADEIVSAFLSENDRPATW